MQAALKLNTTVLPGHRVEVASPELPEGVDKEVTITLQVTSEEAKRFSLLAALWYQETLAISSVSQIAMHPAYAGNYQEIT